MQNVNSHLIHKLIASDINHFRALLKMFGKAFEDNDTYIKSQPRDEYIKTLLQSDHFIALVALLKDTVVGGLTAYELRKFEQERSEIYVYDLAVESTHRRLGIATDLLTQLKAIAKSRGANVIFIQADLGDDLAIELYTKLGRREEVLHFDIPID